MSQREALRDAVDERFSAAWRSHLEKREPQNEVPSAAHTSPSQPPAQNLNRVMVEHIAGDAMCAPTDGSEARFLILCDRARGTLEYELSRLEISLKDAEAIRSRLEKALETHRHQMVSK